MKWRLLGHASAVALLASAVGPLKAHAETAPNSSHFTLELSGDWDRYSGGRTEFRVPTAEFPQPTIGPKDGFGIEGRGVYQPASSPWQFGVGVRYGRTKTVGKQQHFHSASSYSFYTSTANEGYITNHVNTTKTQDLRASHKEHHIVADFDIGREVGLGGGVKSVLTAGLRFANFEGTTTSAFSSATSYSITNSKYAPITGSGSHSAIGSVKRKLNAIGPRVAWHASMPIASSPFSVDWDVGAAVLFGKQHVTSDVATDGGASTRVISRSTSVNIPNVDGRLALAWHAPSAGLTLKAGIRGEGFFRVMDGGYAHSHSIKRVNYGPFVGVAWQFQ